MDLNRISVFVRVVDEQGFTAAARALGLPKSSVSRSVALLEEALGARLLHRSTRSVRLTEAGAAFYERASRGVATLEEAAAMVADLQGVVRGTVRITAPVDVGISMLEPAVARFVKRHPAVRVDVVLTGRVVDLVEEGFDLALRAGPVRDGSLIARKIGQIEDALYASPRYLERAGVPARLADLAAHRCVLFREPRGRAAWTLQGPAGDETVEVQGSLTVDELSFARRAVLAGVGVGLLPAFLCARDVARGRLVRVLPSHLASGAPLHLVYPSARYLPHRVAALRDLLVEALTQRLGGGGIPPPYQNDGTAKAP
ncbi:LysR family transcriptional regulator [Sorangium sp. So ce1024]|uniref:LysR family transcriptional regulator n=1 Tax=Sorangium sp. So ce1024 TaxID=3133327 RepID=UPI003F075AD3